MYDNRTWSDEGAWAPAAVNPLWPDPDGSVAPVAPLEGPLASHWLASTATVAARASSRNSTTSNSSRSSRRLRRSRLSRSPGSLPAEEVAKRNGGACVVLGAERAVVIYPQSTFRGT
jgi:hypothetical protein